MSELNVLSTDEFIDRLRGIWENSPWIPTLVDGNRPYSGPDSLMEAMWGVVRSANDDRQLALLTAHPDLAGRIARAGELSPESSMEQAVAGLDQLTSTEYERFTELNAAYRKRFGFPFIICVRNHTKQEILQRFAMRLVNSRDVEMENALEEVRKIAEYRMSDLIDP